MIRDRIAELTKLIDAATPERETRATMVRTIVLNWSLKLEEDGILGEEMSFSPAEREIAAGHTYNISNFYSPVSGSQIQQGTNNSSQRQE